YVHDLFFHQTAGRYAKSWDHPQPWWYYVPIVLFDWFPLSLAYVGAVTRWRRDLAGRDARVLLPLAWAALVFVFFSIPHGKRDVYLMPALPMIALALAPHLGEIASGPRLRKTAFALALGAGIAILGLGLAAIRGHSASLGDMLRRRELDSLGNAVWAMFVAIGAAFIAAAAAFRPRRGVH